MTKFEPVIPPSTPSGMTFRARGRLRFAGHYPEYNAALLDRVNLETDAQFADQVEEGIIEILDNFPDDGKACIVIKRQDRIVIYRYTNQGVRK